MQLKWHWLRVGVVYEFTALPTLPFGSLLANANNTLIITAADADHASFGCEDKAKWTYFGDAFFNAALRRASNLKEAFFLARSLVSKRELREGFDPSNPQMVGGEKVEPLLVARPLGARGAVPK